MVHHLKDGIEAIFAPDCSLVIETAKLVDPWIAWRFQITINSVSYIADIIHVSKVHAWFKERAKNTVWS